MISNSSNYLKCILKVCSLLIGMVLLAGLFMTLANLIPVNQVHKEQSLKEFEQEGRFPVLPALVYDEGNMHSMLPTSLELATDALMMKMALYDGENAGIHQAFWCYSTHYEDDYSRYWHGYVLPLRFLQIFFDYYNIRLLNCLIQPLLIGGIALLLYRKLGFRYVALHISGYLFLMPLSLGFCLQYSNAFYATYLSLLLYLLFENYWKANERYLYFFLMVGGFTNFLDLLTYPLLSWGICILWVLILDPEMTILQHLKKVVLSALFWTLGFSVQWVGKWVLGSIILQKNLFAKAFSEANMWLNDGSKETQSLSMAKRIYAMVVNWNTYQYWLYLILLIAWLACSLFWIFRYQIRKSTKCPALLLVSYSCPAWYFVLASHSMQHQIFTHRIYVVGICAAIAISLLSADVTKHEPFLIKTVAIKGLVLGGCIIVSYFLMLSVRDYYLSMNGENIFEEVSVSDSIELGFVPQYSHIEEISIKIQGYQPQNCTIILADESGNSISQFVIPSHAIVDGDYYSTRVDWDLHPGKQYYLYANADSNQSFIVLKTEELSTGPEQNSIVIDGQSILGHLLLGIRYYCQPVGPKAKLYYWFTLFSFCLMITASVVSIPKNNRYTP